MTIAVLVLMTVVALLGSIIGIAGVIDVSDSCRPDDCLRALGLLGAGLAALAPWIALVPLGTWAVVRLARRRTAWWVALLALPLGTVVFTAGVLLVVIAEG